MQEVFLQVLNMSITAGFVIVPVIIVRLMLKKVPKIFSYILWSAVLFRLICPFSFKSIYSLLPVNSTPIPSNVAYTATPRIDSGITAINNVVNPLLPAPVQPVSANPLQIWIVIGEFIWIIGIAVSFLYCVISLLRLRTGLVGAVKLRDNIYLADYITYPFVMGLIRPKIYLPSTLTEREQSYIILHEQTHIRRLDHIIRILAFAVLAIHWFNPLVWVAFILSGNDMELSCDESVMKHMDTDIRGDYSASLLCLATGRRIVIGMPLAFGEGNIKKRIKNIMNFKKPAFRAVIVTAVAVIAVAIGLIADPPADRASIQWAKDLKASDVDKIELVTSPAPESEPYRLFEDFEYADIIELINGSHGKYLKNPENVAGGGVTFYVTLMDGTRHSVCNDANRYLIIDGDYFDPGYDWLASWSYTEGSTTLPENYNAETGNSESVLTIEALREIVEKGEDISWEDFSQYKNEDIGSGLYICKYDIDEKYYVLIGGAGPEKAPMYVRLYNADTKEFIDLWTENIDDFINNSGNDDIIIDNIGSVLWYLRKYQGEDTGYPDGFERYEFICEDLNPDTAKVTVLDDMIWNHWDKWSNILVTLDRFLYLAAKDDKEESMERPVLVSSARFGDDRRIYEVPDQTVNQLTVDVKTEKIYFAGWSKDDSFPQSLYETDINLERPTEVLKLDGWLLTVFDDYVYYFAAETDRPGIYRVPVDGTEEPELYDKTGFVAKNYLPVIYSEIKTEESGQAILSFTLKKRDGDVTGSVPISH